MFGISTLEFLALAVVALLVLGPDRLPEYAARAARFLRSARRMAANAQHEVRRELGPEFQDISLDDLNPRTFVTRNLFDGDEFDFGDEPRRDGPRDSSRPRSASGDADGQRPRRDHTSYDDVT